MKSQNNYLILLFTLLILLFLGCAKDDEQEHSSPTSYQIGHQELQFFDDARKNRSVTAELFYPSQKSAEGSPLAKGTFPLILFAHGYQQLFTHYEYLYQSLVPQGYIVVLLTTEQGLTIPIDAYAEDMVFLHKKLLQADSVLKGHTTQTSALMGHSTGGGAIYLADKNLPTLTTLISLAALGEPYGPISGSSPIQSALQIRTPSLILSAEKDCVTPPLEYQQPLYHNLLGAKAMVTIINGDHCGFSDSLHCPMGESLICGLLFQGETIEDKEQRSHTLELILPWLEYYLKEDTKALSTFTELINTKPKQYTIEANF